MIDHRINTSLGWEPGAQLWAAQIIASNAVQIQPGMHINALVRQTIWASRGEAVDFLERCMPWTKLPRFAEPGSYISGQIAPAHAVATPSTDGSRRFVEQTHVHLGPSTLFLFHLDRDGSVRPGAPGRTLLAA